MNANKSFVYLRCCPSYGDFPSMRHVVVSIGEISRHSKICDLINKLEQHCFHVHHIIIVHGMDLHVSNACHLCLLSNYNNNINNHAPCRRRLQTTECSWLLDLCGQTTCWRGSPSLKQPVDSNSVECVGDLCPRFYHHLT